MEIAEQVASDISYAHSQTIVHRETKPENILFQAGEVVVADIGIALAVRSDELEPIGDALFFLGFAWEKW